MPDFLNKVDSLTEQMTPEQLCAFIHESARKLNEQERKQFLAELSTAAGIGGRKQRGHKEKLEDKITACIEGLRLFDDEDETHEQACIYAEYNEKYDEWGYDEDDDEEEEFIYSDNDGVLGVVEDAANLIHRCIDEQEYKAGEELIWRLPEIRVPVSSDYDVDSLNVREMTEMHLVHINYEKLVMESVYLIYMIYPPEERPSKILSLLRRYDWLMKFSIEGFLQSAPSEVPDSEHFLKLLIQSIIENNEIGCQSLILEAYSLLNDADEQLKAAENGVRIYPVMMEKYLKDHLKDTEPDKLLGLCQKALEAIPAGREIRGRIALTAAEIASADPGKQLVPYWIEAFRSDRTMTNFFRLRFSGDWPDIRENVISLCNGGNRNHYYFFLFFTEQFDLLLKKGMHNQQGIGWSSTFMKQGIALFLLWFMPGEIKDLSAEMKAMLSMLYECRIPAEDYYRGTGRHPEKSSDVFPELMTEWKKQQEFTDEFRISMMKKIGKWIRQRVDAIMANNRRNYYEECAAFVAAYGAVREGYEGRGTKQTVLAEYRQLYSRRINFVAGLKRYGYRG
ncbi:MAG: hypothetical protein IJ242_08065 [Clostridia bacterium]|nr:hypothetical protein [Clostridia bacterium]